MTDDPDVIGRQFKLINGREWRIDEMCTGLLRIYRQTAKGFVYEDSLLSMEEVIEYAKSLW